MGGKKTAGIVLLVIGAVVLLLSLLADTIGIGGSSPVFGPYQTAGSIVGVIAAAAGLVVTLRG